MRTPSGVGFHPFSFSFFRVFIFFSFSSSVFSHLLASSLFPSFSSLAFLFFSDVSSFYRFPSFTFLFSLRAILMKISRLLWPDFSEHLDFHRRPCFLLIELQEEEEEAPFAGFFAVVHNPWGGPLRAEDIDVWRHLTTSAGRCGKPIGCERSIKIKLKIKICCPKSPKRCALNVVWLIDWSAR